MIRSTVTAAALSALAFILAGPAAAGPLNPTDFASIGALPGGNITIDTDALTVNGNAGGVIHMQAGGPDIAVFAFDGGAMLAAGNSITVTGSNPLALLFRGSASIQGTIDVSGGAGNNGATAVPGIGGSGRAGGGRGSDGNPFDAGGSATPGGGPGGGIEGGASTPNSTFAGGGGGFGTPGGGDAHMLDGASYGDPLTDILFAGSGGGGGGWGVTFNEFGGGGGAGGGALEIGALNLLEFVGADILANGGNGGSGFRGGGGGSGGGILLHGFDVSIDVATLIAANGGDGGNFFFDVGGCGGAGRIAVLNNTQGSLVNQGTVEADFGILPGLDQIGVVCFDTPADTVVYSSAANIGQAPTTQPPVASLPEPGSLAVFTLGLAGLGLARRRNRKA